MLSRTFPSLVILFSLLGAMALAADVKDDAVFFSPGEIQKANADIRALKSTFKRDLVIETYRTVPANRSVQVKGMSADERNRFFREWAIDRSRRVARDEIFVLICHEPGHVEINVGTAAEKQGFGVAERNKLRDIIVSRFKEKDYDKGLRESVNYVVGRFDARKSGVELPVRNEVRDLGGFFSAGAIQKANGEIKSIEQRFKKDVVIETFKTVPPSKAKQVEGSAGEARNRIFREWIEERAAESKKDGIAILVCREPSNLQVAIGAETSKKAFTKSDRDKLSDLLMSRFREKKFDDGLTEAVAFIQSRLEENLGAPPPPPVANAVKDQGAFFGADALARANADLKALNQQYRKDIFVETYAKLPASRGKDLKSLTSDERNKLFAQWVQDRMGESKKDGIFVFISKDPRHIQIGVGEQTQKKSFTLPERDQLRDLLVAKLHDNKNDQALLDGVKFIQDRLEINEAPPLPNPVVNDVKDYAGLFSPSALLRSNAAVRELKQNLKQDLLIETFKTVPKAKIKAVDAMDQAAKDRFFADWLAERMQLTKADAIHLLICQNPLKIQIGLGPETAKKAFPPEDRDSMAAALTSQFKEKQYDRAILAFLAAAYDTIDKNTASAPGSLVAGEARDYAGLFSAAVLAKATEELKAIARDRKKTITIEAFRSALPGEAKKVVAMDQASREKYFADWQKKRSGETPSSDFVLLVCREPKQVAILEKDPGKVLNATDRKMLQDRLVTLLGEDKFDQGLTETVSFLGGTLAAPEIDDAAGLFSAPTLESAREKVKDLRRDQKIPLRIRTFKDALPGNDPEESGINLLIAREPPQAKVVVEGLNPSYAFSVANAEQLKDRVQKRIEEKRFDDALTEGALFVQDTVKENLAKGPTAVVSNQANSSSDEKNKNSKKEKTMGDKVQDVQDQVINTMQKDVNMPLWKLVLYLGGGFLGLWVLFGILRALFGGGRPPANSGSSARGGPSGLGGGGSLNQDPNDPFGHLRNRSQPSSPPGSSQGPYASGQPVVGSHPSGQPPYGSRPPVPAPGPNRPNYGNPPPSQGGSPPAGYGANQPGYGQAPGGYGQPQGGYGQPGGGYGAPYGNPPQQGGGFLKSVLGGMLGGAAGAWVYDSFRGSRGGPSSSNWGGSAQGSEPYRAPQGDSYRSERSSTSGGDFGGSAGSGYSSSGGDFDTPAERGGYSSSGGDFSSPASPSSTAGGDFGADESTANTGSGGDFGDHSGGGGDYGAENSFGNQGGGDYGAPGYSNQTAEEEPQGDYGSQGGGDYGAGSEPQEETSGGDFGGGGGGDIGGGGGDFGSGDAGGNGGDFGGDTGGGDFGSGGGGDFGGGDSGGGDSNSQGGDF